MLDDGGRLATYLLLTQKSACVAIGFARFVVASSYIQVDRVCEALPKLRFCEVLRRSPCEKVSLDAFANKFARTRLTFSLRFTIFLKKVFKNSDNLYIIILNMEKYD